MMSQAIPLTPSQARWNPRTLHTTRHPSSRVCECNFAVCLTFLSSGGPGTPSPTSGLDAGSLSPSLCCVLGSMIVSLALPFVILSPCQESHQLSAVHLMLLPSTKLKTENNSLSIVTSASRRHLHRSVRSIDNLITSCNDARSIKDFASNLDLTL